MTKSYTTRVEAPNITQSDVDNARSGDSSTRNYDAAHQTRTEPCVANSKINRSDKICRLLTCNQEVLSSTLNVRTIRKQGKTEELAHLFNSTKQSILGVVDHKLVHSDEAIKTQENAL